MTDIEAYDPTPTALVAQAHGSTRVEASLDILPRALELAAALADNRANTFLPEAYRGKPGEVLACIMQAHELDIGPMHALRHLYIVKGRVAMAAELMRYLVLRDGHSLWIAEQTSQKCTVGGLRRGQDPAQASYASFTMDEATKAGLVNKDNWRMFPADMLLARATGRLCRFTFADVIAGISYTVEEAEDGEVADDMPAAAVGEAPEGAAPPSDAKTVTKPKAKAKAKRAAKPAAEPAAGPLRAPDVPLGDQPVSGSDTLPEGDETGTDDAKPAKSEQRRRTERVVIRCKEAGLDDDGRHAVIDFATGGRIRSAKDVDDEAVIGVLAVVADIEAELLAVADVNGEARVVEVGQVVDDCDRCGAEGVVLADVGCEECHDRSDEDLFGGEPSTDETDAEEIDPTDASKWTPDIWREYLKELDVRVPDALREARSLAQASGWDLPGSLEGLAHPELGPLVKAWADDLLSDPTEADGGWVVEVEEET